MSLCGSFGVDMNAVTPISDIGLQGVDAGHPANCLVEL